MIIPTYYFKKKLQSNFKRMTAFSPESALYKQTKKGP